MKPRGNIHVHRDPVCGLTWPCQNTLCVDPDARWCGRAPQCMGEPELHQLTRLTEIGHQLHMTQQDYEQTFHNEVMAAECSRLRDELLALVDRAHDTYVSNRPQDTLGIIGTALSMFKGTK